MVELEKLKVADASYKAFKTLDRRIEGFLKGLNTRLSHVGADCIASDI